MDGLSASGLADLAGTTVAEVQRLVDLGILVVPDGVGRWTAMERAGRLATDLLPLADRALMACYRRQQELVWIEDLVEDIEAELEAAGVLTRPDRVPAMCFLDLGFARPVRLLEASRSPSRPR